MILKLNDSEFIRTEKPIDISIPIHSGPNPVLAWNCPPAEITPVMTERFVGDVNKGGAVNFNDIKLNPHGNGTHTECVGHISAEKDHLTDCLNEFIFEALLVTVDTEEVIDDRTQEKDQLVTAEKLRKAIDTQNFDKQNIRALVIRTLPNSTDKLKKNYSNTNPTYFSKPAIELINGLGIEHLLVDLPSIDREEDEGQLVCHHAFWNYPNDPQRHKTITELIFVPDAVKDGRYLLNIQITSLQNDASPSLITLYEIYN